MAVENIAGKGEKSDEGGAGSRLADILYLKSHKASVVVHKKCPLYSVAERATGIKAHHLAVKAALGAGAPIFASRSCQPVLVIFVKVNYTGDIYGIILVCASHPQMRLVHIFFPFKNGEGILPQNVCSNYLTAVAEALFVYAVFDMIGDDLALVKLNSGSFPIGTLLEADDADLRIFGILFNSCRYLGNCVSRKHVVGIKNKHPVALDIRMGVIQGSVLSAVFFVYIIYLKLGISREIRNFIVASPLASVVNDKPLKILSRLSAKAIIYSVYKLISVVKRCQNCKTRFHFRFLFYNIIN